MSLPLFRDINDFENCHFASNSRNFPTSSAYSSLGNIDAHPLLLEKDSMIVRLSENNNGYIRASEHFEKKNRQDDHSSWHLGLGQIES